MSSDAGLAKAQNLSRIVRATMGGRVEDLHLDSGASGVEGVLYQAFVFEISYGERYGNLEAGIVLPGGRVLTAPFGNRFTTNSGDEAVRDVLAQMDGWARLRLPDKYLEHFPGPIVVTRPVLTGNAEPPPSDTPYFAQITYRNGARVPVRVFRVVDGEDQQYRKRPVGWAPDDGMLSEHRLGQRDHEIWPITQQQSGKVIYMIEFDKYEPLDIPGLYD